MIVLQIIQTLLGIGSIVSFLWIIVGTPLALISFISSTKTKDPAEKQKKRRITFWALGGYILLIASGILYAIVILLLTSLGKSPIQ